MLWLTCPTCGARPVEEFRFGGELPGVPDRITDPDQRDLDYVWMLDNLDGPSVERWFHEAVGGAAMRAPAATSQSMAP